MSFPLADRSFVLVTSFRIMAHSGDWRGYPADPARVAHEAVIVDLPIPFSVFGVKLATSRRVAEKRL